MSELSEPSDDAASDPGPIARASVRRNASHLMAAQLFSWTLATITSVIVPRYLGPATQGRLSLAYSLWAIGGIVIGLGTNRFLQLQIAQREREGLRLVGPVMVLRTLAFVGVSIVVIGYAALVVGQREVLLLVLILGTGTLIGEWGGTLAAGFLGLEQMATPAWIAAASKALFTLLVVIVVWRGGSVYEVAGAGTLTAIWGLVYYGRRFTKLTPVVFGQWRSQAPSILRGGFPFMVHAAALVLYHQIDVIVISWVATDADLGWYGTAETLFGSLLFPATILTATLFPTFARLHHSDPGALTGLVDRTFSLLLIAAVPVGLGTVLVAPSFAPILYGEEFRETGVVLAALGPVLTLTFGTILFGTIALATGRNRVWIGIMFAASAMTIPLDLVLVPWTADRFDNGALGGALAYIVTETFQFSVGIWLVARHLLRRRTLWRAVRVVAAGGVMFVVGWPLREMLLPVPIVTCAVVYGLALVVLRVLSDDERDLVRDVWRRVRRRSR